MIHAVNTIGAPSVAYFRSQPQEFYDENLIWMNDAELYFRFYQQYGPPLTLRQTLVAVRLWPNQVTNTAATEALREREIRYSLDKHRIIESKTRPIFQKAVNRLVLHSRLLCANIFARLRFWLDTALGKGNSLSRLANKYRSDKGTKKVFSWEGDRHFYAPVYEQYLREIKVKPVRFMEVGIGSGSSLKMWQDFFTVARIYALDIDDFSQLNDSRTTCLMADQSNRHDLARAMAKVGEVDVIIEDGGHYMHQQQISFGYLFKFLKSGGLYFIEDLHTSYWPFNGHDAVYGGIPIDIYPDRSNTTLNMIRGYMATKKISSPYLSEAECEYLNEHIAECRLYDTAVNGYGPNHVVMFRKK